MPQDDEKNCVVDSIFTAHGPKRAAQIGNGPAAFYYQKKNKKVDKKDLTNNKICGIVFERSGDMLV